MDALTLAQQIVELIRQSGLASDPSRRKLALDMADMLIMDAEFAPRTFRPSDANIRKALSLPLRASPA